MTETLSIRIDSATKRRLESLAKRSRRTQSGLAAEAITAFVDAENWQQREIGAGLKQLDAGQGIDHRVVAKWLSSWGSADEGKLPQ
jgi:RHH-type transcriptional regulator, rel operon repressor / antitoxin RelB